MTATAPSRGRRLLDVAAAGGALLVLAVPLVVLALAVRLSSPGPALYRQRRIGEGGRCFTLYKFRSMRIGLPGPAVTVGRDPRITPLGALLRRTSLDELPQLWNILRGDMTLVGPRPESPALANGYPARCRWVLQHRPGLTGPSQLAFRDDETLVPGLEDPERYYLDVVVPRKIAADEEFLRDPTLLATLAVIGDTLRHLTRRLIPAGLRQPRRSPT